MSTSATDDTALFAFEGAIDGSEGESFIVNKDNDRGARSSFTPNTACTSNLQDIRIGHEIIAVPLYPLYTTIYGLSEDNLPSESCLPGVLPVL